MYNIEQLKGRQSVSKTSMSAVAWGETSSSVGQSFTGILFAYLIQLNISGESSDVVCYRW